MLEALRKTVADLHALLPANELVAWTSGNVSGRDPESGHIVIKPSGVAFEDLGPENMVVVDVNANVIEGQHKPSSDTATHCTWACRSRPPSVRCPVKTTTSLPSSETTAEPENTPSRSASMLGASAIGSRRHVTMSSLETCPQCIGPQVALKG